MTAFKFLSADGTLKIVALGLAAYVALTVGGAAMDTLHHVSAAYSAAVHP